MEQVMDKERHRQQVEILKQQNKVTEDRLAYLKDMERKLRQIVIEWKKAEDKNKVMKQMAALLFNKNEKKLSIKSKNRSNQSMKSAVVI